MTLTRAQVRPPARFGVCASTRAGGRSVCPRRPRFGLFSPHYLARNLRYANIGVQVHDIGWRVAARSTFGRTRGEPASGGRRRCCCLFVDARRLLGDRSNQVLLVAAGIIYLALMLYHSTGYEQRGFNRYSLDYVPALLALIASGCLETLRRRWLTAGVVAWSVLYFAVLLPRPNIRIW